MRVLFFFGLIGYTYLFKPGGVFMAASRGGDGGLGVGDELKNSVVFTWAFLEMMGWFWVSVPAGWLLVVGKGCGGERGS